MSNTSQQTLTVVRGTSQAKMQELFEQHNFAELIRKCNRVEILPKRRRRPEDTYHASQTEYEEGVKYIDPVKLHSVAVIFWYTDVHGNVHRTIRMLRVGDTRYDAACRADPAKP